MLQRIHLNCVDSTNTFARNGLQQGRLAGKGLITTARQTAGRGRGGKHWDSDNDLGLWATLFYTDRAEPAFDLVMRVSVSVTATLRELGAMATVKWPNDVVVGQRKICGILAEAFDRTIIAGFGIGLRHEPHDFPAGILNSAVSLFMLTGKKTGNDEFLDRFFARYDDTEDPDSVFARYRALLGIAGQEMLLDERAVRVRDVDRSGALRVADADGKETTLTSGTLRWK